MQIWSNYAKPGAAVRPVLKPLILFIIWSKNLVTEIVRDHHQRQLVDVHKGLPQRMLRREKFFLKLLQLKVLECRQIGRRSKVQGSRWTKDIRKRRKKSVYEGCSSPFVVVC